MVLLQRSSLSLGVLKDATASIRLLRLSALRLIASNKVAPLAVLVTTCLLHFNLLAYGKVSWKQASTILLALGPNNIQRKLTMALCIMNPVRRMAIKVDSSANMVIV